MPVAGVKDDKTVLFGKTCFRPERWDCDLGDRKDISGDGAGRRAESRGKALITTWVVFII